MKGICEYCGQEFTYKHKVGKTRRYCGNECLRLARGYKEYSTAICLNCGKTFQESRDRPNIFCSTKCSGTYYGRLRTIEKSEATEVNSKHVEKFKDLLSEIKELKYIIDHEKRCKECGKWFLPVDAGRRFYCSETCAKKADNRQHDNRLSRNGEPDLTVTLTKLYFRDKGICQICGKHIDFDCDSNSNDYPTVDHIKPLSKGGLHIWSNVQLACRICNSLKSDKWNE